MADLTIRELAERLRKSGQGISVNFSGGQYHAYVTRGSQLVSYERRDDLDQAVAAVLSAR